MHSKTLFAAVTIAFTLACAAPRHVRAQTRNPQPMDNTAQPPTENTTAPSDAATPAQSDNANMPQATSEAQQMVPAQAQLAQNIETKNLQAGEKFKAVLLGKVQLKNGVELPRGTALIGTVSSEPAPQGDKSELALRFTQADLKNGQMIPIQATIVGATPPATQDISPESVEYNSPPDSWDGTTVAFDVNNALGNIDLRSQIAGQNSGVFSSKKSDLKLGARTQLALAIGPQQSGTQGMNQPNGGY